MIYRCHACGHETRYWARAERHCDEHGHPRVEIISETDRKRNP